MSYNEEKYKQGLDGPYDVSDSGDLWSIRNNLMHYRIEKYLGKSTMISYAAYDTDEEGDPVDNLDQTAVSGKCVVQEEEHDYQSEILENPTWLELCKIADILERYDGDHYSFEGIEKTLRADGVYEVTICMGS